MITVLVENLEFDCVIGLLDFERVNEQKIIVSAKFRAKEFIDYAKICEFIKAEFKEKKFLKLEDSLAYFELKFKEKFRTLEFFYMKILKPQILIGGVVGAEIEKFY